ncbi:MAG: CRISPR-associated protein Cas4 [Firmicutes bacterium]|nr:CRISPR-associated protein Cas4 [Bacillota bacterium]
MLAEPERPALLELRVTDVKQFVYCPRIVYFTYLMPIEKKVTRKMEYGKEEHVQLDRLEKRRTFRAYGLTDDAERRFHVHLRSERLALSGVLDMLLVQRDTYYPVEFKYTRRRPELNHKYQLMACAMLLEDTVAKPVRAGFVYVTEDRTAYPVEFTQNMRDFVRATLTSIRDMIRYEKMPPPTRQRRKCVDCEFRRFCNDVH